MWPDSVSNMLSIEAIFIGSVTHKLFKIKQINRAVLSCV